jgi:hypothetical protein
LNRALALPQVLLSKYGTPTVIYAPNPAVKKNDKGVMYTYVRPLATIEPLAVRVGLPINLDWSMTEVGPLAEALISSKSGTQLVAWEHHLGEKLARVLLEKLGGNAQQVPEWVDHDFDSIYVIRITELNKVKRVTLTLDSEGLNNLPEACSP